MLGRLPAYLKNELSRENGAGCRYILYRHAWLQTGQWMACPRNYLIVFSLLDRKNKVVTYVCFSAFGMRYAADA